MSTYKIDVWVNRLLLLFLLLGIGIKAEAQSFVYAGENTISVGFEHIQYLACGDSVTTLEKAKQSFAKGSFIPNILSNLNLGIAKDNYWIRLSILNQTPGHEKLYLNLENPRINEADVYFLENDSVLFTTTIGDYYPFDSRLLNNNLFSIPFQLNTNVETVVYMHIRHKGSTLQLPISILSEKGQFQTIEKNYLFLGLTTGVLAISFCFGIFFFFNSRNRLFVFYSLYIFSVTFWLWATEGFGFQYLWPNYPVYATKLGPPTSVFCLSFFMFTCLEFCKPYESSSNFRKFLLGLATFFFGLGLLPFLPGINSLEPGFMSTYMSVHFTLNFLTVFLLSCYLLYVSIKKNSVVFYYFIAVITALSFTTIITARHSGFVNIPISSGAFMICGILIEVVLMTAGITKQFYIYKQEKENMLISYLEQQKQINQRIIETQDAERRRISKELHDDFGAGLTLITLMSDSAGRKHKLVDEFDQIAYAGRKLANNLSDIIWSMNPETQTLEQVLPYIREELNELLEYAEIAYEISFPEDYPLIKLSNSTRRNVVLVCKEATNNAIKYSKAENIRISASFQNHVLSFEISDNGLGFDTGNKKGNGLRNMKSRIEEISGHFAISSSLSGTVIGFSIPVDEGGEI